MKILPWNWLQDWENSTDPWHVYILHTSFSGSQFAPEMQVKPQVTWEYTELGIKYIAYRKLPDGRELDRVSPLMFPNATSTPDVELDPGPTSTVGWVVPVDLRRRKSHAKRACKPARYDLSHRSSVPPARSSTPPAPASASGPPVVRSEGRRAL